MVSRRRTTWTGIVKPEDLEPEQLERYRQFFELFNHYRTVLPTSPVGTGNDWMAYEKAVAEMGITDDERAILKKLPLRETFPDIAKRYGR